MDETDDKAPELPVETENIRRNSNSVSDVKVIQATDVVSLEGVTRKSSIVSSRTIGDLHLEVKNESSIKRVDSDSKFGVMETISLDVSSQDALHPDSASESATEICENPLMQNRPASLDNNIFENQPSEQTNSEDGPNSLSKYFSLPVENASIDSEGIQFFDALAENSQSVKSLEVTSDNLETTVKVNENIEQVNTDILPSEPLADQATKTTSGAKEASGQPILLKFFAEEKVGKDRDGKAFFDKIAAVTSPDSNVLELNQPIIAESPAANQFIISPASNGEIEESWIPSEKTRQVLVSVITSNNSYVPDKSDLTYPEIIIDDEMDDPVKALLVECNSTQAQNRKVLTVNDVTEDEAGLQKLIEAECYHAAINLTKRLIKSCDQTSADDTRPTKHTPLSLRLWYTRLALLVKLKKFSLAEVEIAAFGDFEKPDLYYEYYPDIYKGKRGTMVPFSFRLLLAELPQYQGNHQIAIDNMYQILNVIQRQNVLCCFVGTMVPFSFRLLLAELPQYQGNHQIAIDNMYQILNVIQRIIKNVQNGCAEDGCMIELSESRKNASLEIWKKREQRVLFSILNCVLFQKDYILAVSIVNILLEKCKESAPQLLSALGRIYLQLGDVKYAQDCFTKAASVSCEKSQQYHVEEYINKALLAIAHNNNEEAYKHYHQAYTLNPNNAMLANNMAVCLLYMGRLKESLSLLEKTIEKNPSSCLHDGILFNTCTLYELESSRCAQKKIAMLELVSKYAGDSFNVSCLKIQPVK